MPHLEMDRRPCCPKCQSRSVKVDKERGFFDFLYTLVLQRPMRCRRCRHRFGAFWDPTRSVVGFDKPRTRGRVHAPIESSQPAGEGVLPAA